MQTLTSNSRRQFLQSLTVLPFLSPRRRSKTLNKYPLPKFAIGDLVASDWINDENPNAPEAATDFGEVLGMRWVQEDDWGISTYPLPENTWVYFIKWTHSTIGCESCFPCYDGEAISGTSLRLINHG